MGLHQRVRAVAPGGAGPVREAHRLPHHGRLRLNRGRPGNSFESVLSGAAGGKHRASLPQYRGQNSRRGNRPAGPSPPAGRDNSLVSMVSESLISCRLFINGVADILKLCGSTKSNSQIRYSIRPYKDEKYGTPKGHHISLRIDYRPSTALRLFM